MLRQLALLAFLPVYLRGGYNQMNAAERMANNAQKLGVPATPRMVKAHAWAMIFAGIALQIPRLRKLAALYLLFDMPFVTWLGHRFWEGEGPARSGNVIQAAKNAGLWGGALLVLAEK